MARESRWKTISVDHGTWTIQCHSWKYFIDFVRQQMLDYNHYVWRGDRCDNRTLSPSFDRRYLGDHRLVIEKRMTEQLSVFRQATCGRRGVNPPRIETENEWWALGQHYGLSTPLLDWTRSPFVALFFAFEKHHEKSTPNRCVYAISPETCHAQNGEILKNHTGSMRPDTIEFFTPQQDENARLVNQNGLFSRCTAGKSIDQWIAERFKEQKKAVLIKIMIPNKEREECLRTLNKMNINHLTLFPDLYGASSFTNMANSIKKY